MVTIPLIFIAGFAVFGCHRWGDASMFHLVVAVLFGLLLAGTGIGPEINQGLDNAVAGIAKSFG